MRCIIRVVIGVVLTVAVTSTADAAILSAVKLGGTTNVFTKLFPTPLGNPFGPPDTLEKDIFQLNVLFAFDEQVKIVLAAPLAVDRISDGLGGQQPGPGVLAAGTRVTSHYIFFDPKEWERALYEITFDSEVVGIATSTDNLRNSDFLGLPGLTYNTSPGNGNFFVITGLTGSDRADITGTHTVKVDLTRWSGNFLRVLTTVPEPTTFVIWSLLGLIGLGLGARRRRPRAAS